MMSRKLAQAFFMATSLLALVLCPHSKVEESFNLQATHDLFYHGLLGGTNMTQFFDHLHYPGVVPRTFAGPFVLATACRTIGLIVSPIWSLTSHPLAVQFLARLLLLMATWHAWFRFAHSLANDGIGNYLLIITACQFHMPFYGSRMLPNTFAMIFVLHAYAEWTRNKVQRSAALLVMATAVFRCDVLLLLFTVGLTWLLQGDLTIRQAIQVGIVSGICSLLLTVPMDTYFWQYLVWPEGQVFYYNAILGKSSDWGTSPWHWYLSSALPKAMLLTLGLIPLSVLRVPSFQLDGTWCPYVLPILAFIGLYSCLGHKEMRFMFPAMPMLNLASAVGMNRLHIWAFPTKDKKPTLVARILFLGGILSIMTTFVGTMVFIAISKHNYPGGVALSQLVEHLGTKGANTRIWIDVASSMSGVSLFGQRAASYQTQAHVFEKAGYELEHSKANYKKYTHLLTEQENIPGFHVVNVAQGYPRLDLKRGRIVTTEAIYVLERDGWKS